MFRCTDIYSKGINYVGEKETKLDQGIPGAESRTQKGDTTEEPVMPTMGTLIAHTSETCIDAHRMHETLAYYCGVCVRAVASWPGASVPRCGIQDSEVPWEPEQRVPQHMQVQPWPIRPSV